MHLLIWHFDETHAHEYRCSEHRLYADELRRGIKSATDNIGNDKGVFRIIFRWRVVLVFLVTLCRHRIHENDFNAPFYKPICNVDPVMPRTVV